MRAKAIGTYGYDLAVLDLVEAAALYRLGDKRQADREAARVEESEDKVAAARASFLRGLIADETGNEAGLKMAMARLAQPASSEQRADADELAARWDLRQGAFTQAEAEAERSADLRRTTMDYHGLARALAVGAAAAARAGDKQNSG